MAEEPNHEQFKTSRSRVTLADAMARAKRDMAGITDAPIDAVKGCAKDAEGNWIVTIDVIERVARMGDNDLLSTYELTSDSAGELLEFQRTRRYHRETGDEA
ncbi:MAG: gas vesicle protein GvpO [Pseudomonadota bacterium]